MAKVLISSLGTGNKQNGSYQTAKYQVQGKEPYETSFVADAIIKFYNIDKLYLVGTKKSIWDEAYHVFGGDNNEYWEDLFNKKEKAEITESSLLEFEKLSISIKPFLIKYGINETEIWENFEEFLKISEFIEDGDEIYLDITHSFRSLSLMSFVMTQFTSSISNKNFKIGGVFYGMLEYSNENNGVTPIVDIKLLLEIQEWIKAIDAIKKYSDFEPLVQMMKPLDIEISVQNTFINLSNTVSMSNLGAMKQFIDTAHKKINAISSSENKIIKLLAPEIFKLIGELRHEKLSEFQYAIAKWFYHNKNYAQSYMALSEAVLTKTCELKEPQEDNSDKDLRDSMKGRIDYPYNEMFLENKDKKNENLNSLSSIRNSIAHQLNNRKDMVYQDICRLKDFIESFESYFRK